MSLPLAKLDLLAGYGIAFGVLAALQVPLSASSASPARTSCPARRVLVGLLAIGNALSAWRSACWSVRSRGPSFRPFSSCRRYLPPATAMRIVRNRYAMAGVLDGFSCALPLTYAYDALARATSAAALGSALLRDVLAVAAFGLGALALGALTLRRRTA